jgi:hypothetical protein
VQAKAAVAAYEAAFATTVPPLGEGRFRCIWYGQRPSDRGCGARGLVWHALSATGLDLGCPGI